MSSTPASPGARQPRLREIDLLRFVAAFAVMGFHLLTRDSSLWGTLPTKYFPSEAGIASFGFVGVDLFFVISGFVILMSLWGRRPGDYFASRVARLFPAYLLSVVAVFALATLTSLPAERRLPGWQYLTNLTMMQSSTGVPHAIAVYWTLWVELRFYILVAVLAVVGVTYRRCIAFMGLWTVTGVLAATSDSSFLHVVLDWNYSPYFVAGMAFYLMYRFGPSLMLWGFVAFSYVLAIRWEVAAPRPYLKAVTGHPDWAIMAGITVVFILMALVALGKLSALRWRGLTILGALTYPLYLFHQVVAPVVIGLFRDVWNPWLVVGVTVAGSLLVAYLVYRFVEVPGQRWLRGRLKDSLAGMREASDGPRRGMAAHRAANGSTSPDAAAHRPAAVVDPAVTDTAVTGGAGVPAGSAPVARH